MARLEGKEVPPVYSFRVVGKTGNVRWVEISAVVFTWEGRPATLNFLTDITERKKAEESILRNYEIQTVLNDLLRISLTGISLEKQLQLFLERIVTVSSFALESKGAIFLAEMRLMCWC